MVLPSHSWSSLISLTHTFQDHHYAMLPTGPEGSLNWWTKYPSGPTFTPEALPTSLHPEHTAWESGRRPDSEVFVKRLGFQTQLYPSLMQHL